MYALYKPENNNPDKNNTRKNPTVRQNHGDTKKRILKKWYKQYKMLYTYVV